MTETCSGLRLEWPAYSGGDRDGETVDSVASAFEWTPLEANRQDLILLDSYVPYRSAANRAPGARGVLFFTFNLNASRRGSCEDSYRLSRADRDAPEFHVATSTNHRK
jgi:hypothetical protein